MIFQEKCFSYYILLAGQVSLSDCLYFSKYWAICILPLFANQAATPWNLKLNLPFLSSCFVTWPKSQDKNLNTLRTKKLFRWNKKQFSSFVKSFQLPILLQVWECAFKAFKESIRTFYWNDNLVHMTSDQNIVRCYYNFVTTWQIINFTFTKLLRFCVRSSLD